jgi:hypothetical protein
MGSRRLAPRLAALVLVISCLGLPIDDLVAYAIMVAAALVILTGSMATSRRRWASAAAVAALVIVVHALWPAPRIDEGDNVFLPGPTVATSSGLPADVLRVALAQFAREYPPESAATIRPGAAGGRTAPRRLTALRSRLMRRSRGQCGRGA